MTGEGVNPLRKPEAKNQRVARKDLIKKYKKKTIIVFNLEIYNDFDMKINKEKLWHGKTFPPYMSSV